VPINWPWRRVLGDAPHVGAGRAGDPEVEDLGLPAVGHEHVGGLEIAMDDAAVVRVLHGGGQLDREGDPIRDRQLLRAGVVGQRRARDQFHHEMRRRGAVPLREGVDLRDAGMLQPAEHLGFVLEAAEDLGMTIAAPQHFDRHRAARPVLLRGIDDAHAAGAQGVQHEEGTETRARLQRPVHGRHVEGGDALGIEEVLVRKIER
jgi:hypothetical protein